MRKTLLAFCCLLALHSFSQKISLAYSGEMGQFSPSSLLASTDGGYLAVKRIEMPADKKSKSWNDYRQSISFVQYDKDFKLIKEVKMATSGGICSGHYSEFKKAGDKYWFIYLEPGAGDAMGNFKAIAIDPASLQQTDARMVAASSALDHSTSARLTYYHHYRTGSSPSGKFTYLYVELTDNDCFISCLDADMKPVWGRKGKKLDGLKDGGICSMEVDDNGYIYTGLLNKKDVLSLSIHSPSGQAARYDVKLDGGKAKEIIFSPGKNNEPVMVYGTYMEDGICTGVYQGMLSNKGALSNIVTTVFPKNIVESMDKEGFSSTKSKKFGLHPAFFAMPLNKGMLLEFRKETGGGASGMSTTLLGGSLIYVDLSAAGPVFARVPKYSVSGIPFQYVYNGQYESGCMYYAFPHDSKMILLYYDNLENLTRDPELDAKIVNPKNEELVAAVIDKDGSIKRQRVVTIHKLNSLPAYGIPGTVEMAAIPIVLNNADAIVVVRL